MKDIVHGIINFPKELIQFLFIEVPTLLFWFVAIGVTLYLIFRPNMAN